MKNRFNCLCLQLFALLFMFSVAHAQAPAPVQPAPPAVTSNFTQAELDQMLAPIALYPDALLSQILMAATYPNEVVEADRWLRANPGYKGEAAVKAVETKPWDISVKSLMPFPNVLSTMASKIDWTERLGQAFLGQQQQVMDTIQALRQKARKAGYLRTDERLRIVERDRYILVEPVVPTAYYVPYYNPLVVYGAWWWPAYGPVYWAPWPGYVVAPGYYGWYWSPVATIITAGLLFAAFDWGHHHVYYGRVDYWRGHYRSGYLGDRAAVGVTTTTTTRWTRDTTKPLARTTTTRSRLTGARTTTTRAGTRTTTRRAGARTTTTRGARTTTGARSGARAGARGTKSTGRPTAPATRGVAPSGARGGGGGAARMGGSGAGTPHMGGAGVPHGGGGGGGKGGGPGRRE